MADQALKKLNSKKFQEQYIVDAAAALIKRSKILHIATLDSNNQPDVAYTQFIGDQHKLYIITSEMTQQCRNLLNDNQNCSIIIHQSESDASNLSVLERFTAQAVASELPYGEAAYKQIMERFITERDAMYERLEKMADFRMFELNLNNARYAQGFGLIFDRVDNSWGRTKGAGHRKR